MERVFRLIFDTFLAALIAFTIYLIAVLSVSPKNDAQNRGFIPCTKELVVQVSECGRGSLWCMAKGIWQDTKCNVKVVASGVKMWMWREQPTPWANYLFVPSAEAELDEDNPYTGVVAEDVQTLENQRSFIEQHQQKLEEAKHRELNLNENVLSTIENAEQDAKYIEEEPAENLKTPAISDIGDEAFLDNIEADESSSQNVTAPTSVENRTKAVLKKNTTKSIEKKGEVDDK